MKYTHCIFSFLSTVKNLILARADVKAGSFNCFGSGWICAAIKCACARVDCTARWLALHERGQVKFRLGQGNSVGFRCACS